MSIVLDPTIGITNVNGTAAAPALTGADTNTGIFYPAADTIAFAEGGVESMRLDSNGNVGIGTSSPGTKLDVFNSSINASYSPNTPSTWRVAQVRNDQTTTSNSAAGIAFVGKSDTQPAGIVAINGNTTGGVVGLGFLTVSGNTTSESMRIDSSGNVLVGATSQFSGFVANAKQYVESSTSDYAVHFRSTATTAYGLAISYSTAPNAASQNFIDARDSSAQRFSVMSNGGIRNFSANNVNLSDERLKTDILPATTYLDKICSIPVVTFKYKDQTDEELNLGVIAQEIDKVAPELVDHSGFGETPEGETPYLSVYQTDLQYALMKCIQEQQTIINNLKARIEMLESK